MYGKVYDYNVLFNSLQENCDAEDIVNYFASISESELIDLHYLLHKFTDFMDDADSSEIEACTAGHYVIRLYTLLLDLFEKTTYFNVQQQAHQDALVKP